jgi:hypothetical protein
VRRADGAASTQGLILHPRLARKTGRDIGDLPADATRLRHMLYSMILVSYAVNVFKQNHIQDSGAAFFEMVAEPAV